MQSRFDRWAAHANADSERFGIEPVKVHIRTFGCRANRYDSEELRAVALASGAEIVARPADADVAVFNSCAVTASAEADLRKAVRRAAKENPLLKSFVMGCASGLELHLPRGRARKPADSAISFLPSVAGVFEGADIDGVATAIGLNRATGARGSAQSGTRALLRIQDGCDEHCTFCATTIARGANRSRDLEQLVDEAEHLSENHCEIVLTGVHIGTYGTDIGTSLGEMAERLVDRVRGARFRLSSVEATEVDDRLLELMSSSPRRLVPYLHAPLQSGSDRILKLMGRHWYTSRTYACAVERIAARVAPFGLGADIIAGFPGETEDDHRATLALVRALPFTSLHVFPYSVRPGTAAERLDERVQDDVAHRRARELRELAEEKATAYTSARVGQHADVVVTGGARPSSGAVSRPGLTEDYLTVAVREPIERGRRFNAQLSLVDGLLSATPTDSTSSV